MAARASVTAAFRLCHDAYEAVRRSHYDSLRMAASVYSGTEIKALATCFLLALGNLVDQPAIRSIELCF
jgi:hypothetical protein